MNNSQNNEKFQNLHNNTIKDLRKIAQKYNIKYIFQMNKQQLINSLTTNYAFKPKSKSKPKSKPDPSTFSPISEYANAEELKNHAKERGIRYSSRMSKKQLCKELGVADRIKQLKVKLINMKTGNVLTFTSLYSASKNLNISASSLNHFAGQINKGVVFKDEMFLVRKNV